MTGGGGGGRMFYVPISTEGSGTSTTSQKNGSPVYGVVNMTILSIQFNFNMHIQSKLL